ncbi:MAG: bifunctional oligoribonuclease/PAP phosphatase NrnA [Clostridia bacterium]|nr:bifunctional oligoribonuclease/PAP phosphatase NrnA [Clostridia bacterium]
MNGNITLEGIRQLLDGWDDILIITHCNPDADTLGSAFGIKNAYPDKKIRVVCADTIPDRLKFITDGEPTDISAEEYSHIMTVDCAQLHLTGEAGKKYGERIELKIDHHRTGDDYAKYNYVEDTTGSAGEIVYKIVKDRLNRKTADSLYAAISSDTGCFRYSNVSADTHRVAAELIEAGADHSRINAMLFENKPKAEIAATRLALNNLKYYFDGRVALVTFTNAEKEKNGIDDDSLGAVSSLTREIEGVELGIVIKEKTGKDGLYKLSMRSTEAVDCSAVCKLLGGGGHMRASGGSVTADSIEEATELTMNAVREIIG